MTAPRTTTQGTRLGEWIGLYCLSVLAALVLSALLVEATGGDWGTVDVAVVEALGPHPFGQRTRIGGETGDADPQARVDVEDLLLVRAQLRHGPLQGAQDCVRFGAQADRGGALLHRLHGIFDL